MNLAIPRTGRRRVATVISAALLGAGLVAAAPVPAHASAGCAAAYNIQTFWGTGLQASVTLTPGDAVTSWTAEFDVADDQVVAFTYNATFVQTGHHVKLTNTSFDGTVAAGRSVVVGVGIHSNPSLTNVAP